MQSKNQRHIISAWGNYPKVRSQIIDFTSTGLDVLPNSMSEESIPYGNGRSYGDSALSNTVVKMHKHNHMLSFNEANGVLHCQSGVLLSEILEVFTPRGWFLNVSPGTKFVSVGGAIASDIHGKNHHIAGSFSDYVEELNLLLPDGSEHKCSKQENIELFRATCGGMGLTGIITDAKIKLKKINSVEIEQTTIKTKNLKDTFEAFEKYKDATYSVAWIDCLAKGDNIGRCLLMVGEHSNNGNLNYTPKKKITIPFNLPSFTLNKLTVSIFNMLYYGKVLKKVSTQQVSIEQFFYPLDAINHWNRIYGKNGFTQYQFVLPIEYSYEGLKEILKKVADSGKASFLSVLKLFGNSNDNYLSFPKEGYTLTMDFKIEPDLFELLDELDKIVVKYEGRIYLTKDVRVPKSVFEKGYPNIEQFKAIRKLYEMDKKYNSLQSIRLSL